MKKLLFIFAVLAVLITPIFAASGTIHLIYTNGQIVEDVTKTYYEFDIQAYISEGNEVIGAGMVYVEYPTSVFGEIVISNNRVEITKTGILAGTFPEIAIYLYDIYENDTFADVFAITFEATLQADLKPYYSEISNDPLAPSDMLHIRMEVLNYGTGNVLFPSYIPGLNTLYFNFENEAFSDGLDLTEATEPVVYEDPIPDPVGTLTWKSLDAAWKKNVIEVKWSTKDEVDIVGYVVKRSTNGGEPVEVASYLTDPALVAQGLVVSRYEINDADVMASNIYTYYIEAIDIVGAAIPSANIDVVTEEALVESSYPNPFNPSFVVPFELYRTQNVDIKLYDMTGRVVKNVTSGNHAAGRHEYHVNCDDLSSGVYLLRTVVDEQAHTQKMLLVK